jgi:hypothetical protein
MSESKPVPWYARLGEAVTYLLDHLASQPLAVPKPGVVSPVVVKGLIDIMGEVKEIRKNGYNKEGKYHFLYFGDVYAHLQDALIKHRLQITQREISRSIHLKILFIQYQYDVLHESGQAIFNVWSNSGACRIEFKSGGSDDKAANKCSTAGMKLCLLHLFKIPPDDHNTERLSDGDGDAQHHTGAEDPDDRRDDRRRDDRRDDRGRDDRRGDDRPRDDRRGDDRRGDDRPRDGRRDNRPGDWGSGVGEDRREDRREDRLPPGDITRPFNNPPPEDRWADTPPDDRRGDPPASRRSDGPPNGDLPTDGPPDTPDDAALREQLRNLKRMITNAKDENDAHDIWRDHADVLRRTDDKLYEHMRSHYEKAHGIYPPKV